MIAVVLFLIAGGAVAALLAGGSGASNEEIFLAPAEDPGTDAFTETVAVAPPTPTTAPTTEAPSTGGTKSFFGSTAGLYGGTRDNASCDTTKLVSFLQANPDKARAWAGVLGIQPAGIADYVAKLTPVTLRHDTRVTNHGFRNGRATTLQSVLQAGTAVLVSPFGVPVVRSACGNPLLAPKPVSSPTYTGPEWTGFDPATLVVVQRTEIEINQFTLVDSATGETFVRPAGQGGVDRDGPAGPATSTTTTSEPAPTSTTAATRDIAGTYVMEFEGPLSGPCTAWPVGTGSMTVTTATAGIAITITYPSGFERSYRGSFDSTSGAFDTPDVDFGRNPLTGTFTPADAGYRIDDGREHTQNVNGDECLGGFTARPQ